MAAIEKVCEFSGDYHGGKMYKWKNNHIQVSPKYRGYFEGKEHVLFIFNGVVRLNGKKEFRTRPEFEYCLYVPELQGNVNGEYWNETYRIYQTMFNLWELMGRVKLNVNIVDNHDYYPCEYAKKYDIFDLDNYETHFSW